MNGARIRQWTVDTLRPAATPLRPAVLRIGVGLFAARHHRRRRALLRGVHAQDPRRFAAQTVNVLATLGVAHRVTGPLNAALQLWTLTYRNSWGMLYHNDNMLVLHQMVLGAGPTADALSVDALVRRRGLAPAVFERRYGAVPVMLNAVTSAVYFVSGVAKVRSSTGFGWASGDVLRGQIAIDGLRKDLFGSTRPAAGAALYHRGRLFTVMAAVSLAVELGAPLSLLDRRLGLAFSAAAWGMHIGIREIMGISFPYNTSGVSYLGHLPGGPQLRR